MNKDYCRICGENHHASCCKYPDVSTSSGVHGYKPDISISLMAALHGMLIVAGVVSKDSKLSGQDTVEIANKYLSEKEGL